jgi:hypothetical protein
MVFLLILGKGWEKNKLFFHSYVPYKFPYGLRAPPVFFGEMVI